MQPKENLIVKAAHLAKSSPTTWANFLAAFEEVAEVHRKNLLLSPLPELQVNQGRAQAMASLLEDLKNCEANAVKIAQKGNVK